MPSKVEKSYIFAHYNLKSKLYNSQKMSDKCPTFTLCRTLTPNVYAMSEESRTLIGQNTKNII